MWLVVSTDGRNRHSINYTTDALCFQEAGMTLALEEHKTWHFSYLNRAMAVLFAASLAAEEIVAV